MIKKILTVSAVACAAFLAGCGEDVLNPVSKDEVSIALTAMSDIAGSTTAVTTAAITATIDANVAITAVDVTVKKADGTAATGITVVKGTVPASKEKITVKTTGDMPISLSIATTATNGTYIYTLSATAGSATSSKSDTIVLSGMSSVVVGDTLSTKQVTLGAAGNNNGSSLDVDSMKVYKSAQVTSQIEGYIDVWFAFTSGSENKLFAPSLAASNGWAPKDWTVKNATLFLKTGAVFANVKTQSGIDSLWTGTGATSIAVTVGDVVVVKTVAGNYRLLKIDSVAASTSGEALVTGRIK